MKESDFYFREIPLAAGGHPRDRDSCLSPSPFFLFPPDRCSWKQQSSRPHRGGRVSCAPPRPREEWGEEKRVEAGGGPAEGHGHGREGGGGGGGNGEGPCR